MLDHPTVDHAPNVDVGPRHIGTRGVDAREEGHCRRLMTTAKSHVMRDEVAVGYQVVILGGDVTAKAVQPVG